jgi:hypothetical protein
MRGFCLLVRVALFALALAALVGQAKWGYGFSTGR